MQFDLSEALGLFVPGVMAGLGLGTLSWLIGYLVSAAYAWIRKS